jgi:hypothetical protein
MSYERGPKVEQFSIRRKAQRVTRFAIVQFIALLGWIFVQLFFSISPVGRTFSFGIILIIEAIWWMGLLLIMLLLFLIEYNRFVQAAVELEDANNRLRRRANAMLGHARDATMQALQHGQDGQDVQEDGTGEAEASEVDGKARGGGRSSEDDVETIKLNDRNRGARRREERKRNQNARTKEARGQEENTGGRGTGTDG